MRRLLRPIHGVVGWDGFWWVAGMVAILLIGTLLSWRFWDELRGDRVRTTDLRARHHSLLHGFRATFRSWALENGADWSASELALDHKLGNAVTQAYVRSDMLDRRRGLMERWANHLTTR